MPQAPSQPGRLVRHTSAFRRFVIVYYALLTLLLLILLPPLISVDRLQRRIATSISQSLGRPVHLDNVSLTLFPAPGFLLQNLVVSEDPAFGSEPIIRANTVRATLRLSSLWTRRVEFSTIAFTEPSVNLVHLANGTWNLESILLQASRIPTAPTAQRNRGSAPRFPYIEATGARLNLKLGVEKTPFSLTDASFALWLPQPEQWHLRLEAHPARTDTSASDTGLLRLEGTLGRAPSLLLVPLDLTASWTAAPLGEASLLLLGHDASLRGTMDVAAHAQGTLGDSELTTHLQITQIRRADFVPAKSLNLDIICTSRATSAFHSFPDLHCGWPATPSGTQAPSLTLNADLPDIREPHQFTTIADAANIPSASLIDWLRIVSSRVPPDTSASGQLTAHITYRPPTPPPAPSAILNGTAELTHTTLTNPRLHLAPLKVGDLLFESTSPAPAPTASHSPSAQPNKLFIFALAPTSLPLGGKDPATIEGSLDSTGYTLHLTGMVLPSRLQALGNALPQFGDGMEAIVPTSRSTAPLRIDITATRPWFGPQTWQQTTQRPAPAHHPKSR